MEINVGNQSNVGTENDSIGTKLPEGQPEWLRDVQVFTNISEMRVGAVYYISADMVTPDPTQPRTEFDEEKLKTLAMGIFYDGQEEPAQAYFLDGKLILLNGERRHRACLMVKVPICILLKKAPVSKGRKLLQQLISNENREGLPELNQAISIKELLESNISMAEIRRTFNKSDSWINQRLKLLKLIPAVQEMMSLSVPEKERLKVSTAITIADAPESHQLTLAQEAIKLPIGRARMMVREKLGKNQLTTDVDRELGRKRGPNDDRRVLDAYISRTSNGAVDFNNLRPEKLGALYANLPIDKRRVARVKIQAMLNNIQTLAETLLDLPELQEDN